MTWRAFPVIGLLVAATAAEADSLDLNIHEEAFRVVYAQDVGKTAGSQLEFGYLYNDAHDNLGHIGFHVFGENWSKKGTFGISIGARVMAAETDVGDVAAVGLGGRVRFSPAHRFGITAEGYYSPGIATFLDGEHYREGSLQVDYQLLPQAFIYLGYRVVKLDIENEDLPREVTVTLDDEAHVGMRLLF